MQTRLRVRRHPERGVYDPEPIYAILDEGMIAHVGFLDAESPVVIPTAYGRDGALRSTCTAAPWRSGASE